MPLSSHNLSSIAESTPDFTTDDAVTNEFALSDLSELPRVVIQKAHSDDSDDDGDEWLEKRTRTGGPCRNHARSNSRRR